MVVYNSVRGLYTCRYIHATPSVSKSVKEKFSDVAEKVNKKVGQGLASAIETGEKATEKTKDALGVTGKRAKERVMGVKGGANRVVHTVKEAGHDVTKEAGKNARKDL